MRHESSYKENMKNSAMERRRKDNAFMLDLFSQMIIDELILKSKREKLLVSIDEALDKRDEGKFYNLSQEYIDLMNQFYK